MGGSTKCCSIEERGSWVRGEIATGGRDHQARVGERQARKILSSIWNFAIFWDGGWVKENSPVL